MQKERLRNGTRIETQDSKKLIYKYNDLDILELFKKDEEEWIIPDYSWFCDNDYDFEIIQDDIDIDSIEEISFELDNNGIATKTINELIKAVKQLNQKIGE